MAERLTLWTHNNQNKGTIAVWTRLEPLRNNYGLDRIKTGTEQSRHGLDMNRSGSNPGLSRDCS